VAWAPLQKVSKTSSIQTRHWIIKRAARDCGANAVLFKRRQRHDDRCTMCSEPETVLHVYQCQSEGHQREWDRCIQELRKELIEHLTDPTIVEQLCQGLNLWQKGELVGDHSLLKKQSLIGWDGILEGVLGIHWQHQQEAYLTAKQSKKSGIQWSMMVIRKLWKIAWSLWQYRNTQEHAKDMDNEWSRLKEAVDAELEVGHQGIVGLDVLFRQQEIEKALRGQHGYTRAWLRNVKTRRQREFRKYEMSGEMERMRQVMRKFLQLQGCNG
jgi:hypothetical protein